MQGLAPRRFVSGRIFCHAARSAVNILASSPCTGLYIGWHGSHERNSALKCPQSITAPEFLFSVQLFLACSPAFENLFWLECAQKAHHFHVKLRPRTYQMGPVRLALPPVRSWAHSPSFPPWALFFCFGPGAPAATPAGLPALLGALELYSA